MPDDTVETDMNIIYCKDNESCGHNEMVFRQIFSDQNITLNNPTGQWLKERIGWTKPASGS